MAETVILQIPEALYQRLAIGLQECGLRGDRCWVKGDRHSNAAAFILVRSPKTIPIVLWLFN
ncbi:MAG: hypothetical protein NT070_21265 [Cyanobacteria bacterium]|nr:hypothetical protein [Cyanobacteriota bacterium]